MSVPSKLGTEFALHDFRSTLSRTKFFSEKTVVNVLIFFLVGERRMNKDENTETNK